MALFNIVSNLNSHFPPGIFGLLMTVEVPDSGDADTDAIKAAADTILQNGCYPEEIEKPNVGTDLCWSYHTDGTPFSQRVSDREDKFLSYGETPTAWAEFTVADPQENDPEGFSGIGIFLVAVPVVPGFFAKQ
jgi:hypothetical protein